ncbi:MAG: hypothetical protein ACK58T_12725, partial [Phycisphaerae bacterium]
MAVTYESLMGLKSLGDVFTYTDRETMLYALGVGMGRDPMNTDELPYVYENGLRTIPTMASVIAWGQATIGQAGPQPAATFEADTHPLARCHGDAGPHS